MAELISLLVTTYNREDALDAVLRGLARQTDSDFEVVVADDGSGPATRRVIEDWAPRLGRPLHHVWQEDRGFRVSRIRNLAIAKSSGAYCIFIDGDCIAFPDFVARHRALAQAGCFVAGNRILLSRELTERVLNDKQEPETWTFARWTDERRRGGINRLAPLIRLPLGPLRTLARQGWRGIRSANLGVWRKDLLRVDGFDASYTGWGRADSDLVVRLMHAGVRRKDGRFATGVLHLWHPESDRSRLAQNEILFAELVASDRARARQGVSALADETARDAAGPVTRAW